MIFGYITRKVLFSQTIAYYLYVRIEMLIFHHTHYLSQTLIFGCITRKVLSSQTEAYLLYVRVEMTVPDDVRRQIAKLEIS